MSSGLQLLSGYSSDEESESMISASPDKRRRLPLPSTLKIDNTEEVQDDPSLHDGRQRKYPHERGNWSSIIYIPYEISESFDVFCDHLMDCCKPDVELIKINEPHISLSKTFILRYHWINEFSNSLKEKLKIIPRFEITFDGLEVYCNEDFSRTFLALTVGSGKNELSQSIEIIDNCLDEYKLEPYYEESSFHMSIAWCLGNKKKLLQDKMQELLDICEDFESSDFSFPVDHYLFKTGFKEFKLAIK